ncbi:hypothetical protein [Dysgonomonas sp. 25]|uniref:hypothetical protein n=1 Tax=Dysgonomonas sp. 25 TaxID=2302933 RepID=UPI0013D36B05|nr:hypothetical protein [Dysgonomonas sp. 25]NDV69075.1 hypothetical protein [Dysgonomonas sp. 25]
MILFGWYTFLIKSYMFEELGIPTEDIQENMRVEVRQKCFHLFWIPFFSIGKLYALRRGDGKLYELPAEMENFLRTQTVHKTPWYTYIGLMLVAAVCLFFWVNGKYESYQSNKQLEQFYEKKHEVTNNPQIKDEYILWTNTFSNIFVAEVVDVKSDSVQISLLKKKGHGEASDVLYEPQWVTKEEIANAVPIREIHCKDSLQLYIPELGGVTSYSIYRILRGIDKY